MDANPYAMEIEQPPVQQRMDMVVKNVNDMQQFIVNESNRVDGELQDLRLAVSHQRTDMILFEDNYALSEHLAIIRDGLNARLDEHYDVLQDHTEDINKLRAMLTGVLAGQRLARSEPSSVWAIAALQTINQMAEQMNQQREVIERLQARMDVQEFRFTRNDDHNPMPGTRIGEASHPGPDQIEATKLVEMLDAMVEQKMTNFKHELFFHLSNARRQDMQTIKELTQRVHVLEERVQDLEGVTNITTPYWSDDEFSPNDTESVASEVNHDPMPGTRIGEASHPGPANTSGMDMLEQHLDRGVDPPERKKQRTMTDALALPHTRVTRDRCGVQVMENNPGSGAGSSMDRPEPVQPPAEPVPALLNEPEPVPAALLDEPDPMEAPKQQKH